MEFPIALEAYPKIEEEDSELAKELIERRVVFNELEANQFISEHSPHNRIVTKPLTADELGDERIN